MDLPPPAGENELPKSEMGQFIEPTIEKKLGLRTACFSDSEKNVTEFVISRNEENGNDVDTYDESQGDTISNLNTGEYNVVTHRLDGVRKEKPEHRKGEDFEWIIENLCNYAIYWSIFVVNAVACSINFSLVI